MSLWRSAFVRPTIIAAKTSAGTASSASRRRRDAVGPTPAVSAEQADAVPRNSPMTMLVTLMSNVIRAP